MPEIRNMRTNVAKLLSTHERLNKAIMDATEKGEQAIGHANDYGKMYESVGEDMVFAATMLGNSGGQSGTESDEKKPETKAETKQDTETQTITAAEVGNVSTFRATGS